MDGGAGIHDEELLKEIYLLNSRYMGMGMSNALMASGVGYVSQTTIINSPDLHHSLLVQNGTADFFQGLKDAAQKYDPLEQQTQLWVQARNAEQRGYVSKWREQKWARKAELEAQRKAIKEAKAKELSQRTWPDRHLINGSSGIQDGHGSTSTNGVANATTTVFGPPGSPDPMAGGSAFTNGHPEATSSIIALDLLVPDNGTGATYLINFYDNTNTKIGSVREFVPAQPLLPNGNNAVYRVNLSSPIVFSSLGGRIEITVNKSFMWGPNTYDACWNVEIFYRNWKI